MKHIILLTTAIIALAGSASAWGTTNNGGDASASANANQGQNQGQLQGQGQVQGQAINNNQVYQEASQAPGIAAGNCDAALSIGTNGTLSGNLVPLSAGGCWQTHTGNSGRIAALYIAAGANAQAIQVLDNTNVAKRARRATGTVTRTSTRSAPAAQTVSYKSCYRENGVLHVSVKRGMDSAQAQADCRASCV